MPTGGHILWSASLPPTPLQERVRIAATAGFDALSVSPADARDLAAAGRPLPDARRAARDAGVELAVLDAYVDWYPYPPPRRPLGIPAPGLDELLDAAAELGVRALTALAPYATDAPAERLVEGFAALCDRAAPIGLDVNLEFTPFPPVPSLRVAWDIVRQADRPNGAITLDAWHFFQGEPDLDLLRSLPPGRVTALQLSDGHVGRFQASLAKDTFRHRLMPGDGDFDLGPLVAAVVRGDRPVLVGPEVLAEELFALSPAAAAAKLAAASAPLLAYAAPGPGEPRRS